MGSIYFSTSGGHGACRQGGEVWPMLRCFADANASDLPLGNKELVLDRGFIAGEWLSELWRQGINVTIGLRSDMDIFADLLGLARLPGCHWQPIPIGWSTRPWSRRLRPPRPGRSSGQGRNAGTAKKLLWP